MIFFLFLQKKLSNSQYFVEEENHLNPKTIKQDLFASKKTNDDISYFIPTIVSEKNESESLTQSFTSHKTPLLESNVVIEGDLNIKICKVFFILCKI